MSNCNMSSTYVIQTVQVTNNTVAARSPEECKTVTAPVHNCTKADEAQFAQHRRYTVTTTIPKKKFNAFIVARLKLIKCCNTVNLP